MPRWLRTFVISETIVLATVTIATPQIDENEIIRGISRITQYGPLYFWFVLHFVGMSLAMIITFLQKLHHFQGVLRRQLVSLAWGCGAGLAIGAVTNIFIPMLTGWYDIQHTGPIAALLFIGATTYATAKSELFNLKILTTEVMVAMLVLSLAVTTFLTANIELQIFEAIITIITVFFGITLIRQVRLDVERGEEVARLNETLAAANLQLQETDQIKNEFITMASHQLRTPISVVKGYLSLMLEGAYGTVPDTIKDKLKQMYGLNDRLVQMIDNMLNVARIEKRKIEYNVTMLDILPSVRAVVEPMRLKASAKRLTLNFSAPNQPMMAYLDEGKFQEVLTNLVDNAIKYTDAGTIEVTVRGDVEGTGYVDVLVKDSGIGMSPDEAGRVFTKFFRSKEAVIREPGTGLGLFIGAKFMGGMGGRLDVVETATGKGTTFAIRLPTHQEEPGMPII